MSASTKNFLAVYVGSPTSPRMATWLALPEEQRKATERAGIQAWLAWAKQHASQVVDMGGPLGKTKSASEQGITDIRNSMGGYTIVRAASHDEAAQLFVNHPHFAIFPGTSVEIMECLPVPTVHA